ncbi:hypothetical protein [Asaia platycodi]|nr:hypothetical protein [Asaia platycodi]
MKHRHGIAPLEQMRIFIDPVEAISQQKYLLRPIDGGIETIAGLVEA